MCETGPMQVMPICKLSSGTELNTLVCQFPIISKMMYPQPYTISSARQDAYVNLNPDAMPDAMVTPHIRMPPRIIQT